MVRNRFYDAIRLSMFDGRLSQSQLVGCEAILDRWDREPAGRDDRHLAYMLATAFHETAGTMQPVRETLASTDEKAVAALESAWRKGRLTGVKNPYWRADADGKVWIGRGLVQLTHKANYQAMSHETGVDLVDNPRLAMGMDVAVHILFAGMEKGLFTGRRLAEFFNPARQDWAGARRIINGMDRAALVAGYGRKFYSAICSASGALPD